MRQLNAKQVHHHLQHADDQPFLLDVREPFEVKICAIPNSVNIPLAQLPRELPQLPQDKEIILICHHGNRSQRAGMYLRSNGYENLINLVGGIDAWACDIATDMPRY